jgi:hypothetical protein
MMIDISSLMIKDNPGIYIALGTVLGAIISILGSLVTSIVNKRGEKEIEDAKRLESKLEEISENIYKKGEELNIQIQSIIAIQQNKFKDNNAKIKAFQDYLNSLRKNYFEINDMYCLEYDNFIDTSRIKTLTKIYFPALETQLNNCIGHFRNTIKSIIQLRKETFKGDTNINTEIMVNEIEENFKQLESAINDINQSISRVAKKVQIAIKLTRI